MRPTILAAMTLTRPILSLHFASTVLDKAAKKPTMRLPEEMNFAVCDDISPTIHWALKVPGTTGDWDVLGPEKEGSFSLSFKICRQTSETTRFMCGTAARPNAKLLMR